MNITDAVVPVAGLGSRLLPATRSQPKEMLPLVEKPVVQFVVEELARAGIERVLLVTGRRKRAIEDHFDAAPELGLGPLFEPEAGPQLLYTRQGKPSGLGDALRYADGFAPQRPVVVALGDAVIDAPADAQEEIVERLARAFTAGRADAALAVAEVPSEHVSRYGITRLGEELPGGAREVLELVEKPDPAGTPSRNAVMARYVLGPAVFAALNETGPGRGGEVQLTDALERVRAAGGRIVAVSLTPGERRHDIGSPESYAAAFLEHALRHPRFGDALRRRAAELLDEAG